MLKLKSKENKKSAATRLGGSIRRKDLQQTENKSRGWEKGGELEEEEVVVVGGCVVVGEARNVNYLYSRGVSA